MLLLRRPLQFKFKKNILSAFTVMVIFFPFAVVQSPNFILDHVFWQNICFPQVWKKNLQHQINKPWGHETVCYCFDGICLQSTAAVIFKSFMSELNKICRSVQELALCCICSPPILLQSSVLWRHSTRLLCQRKEPITQSKLLSTKEKVSCSADAAQVIELNLFSD